MLVFNSAKTLTKLNFCIFCISLLRVFVYFVSLLVSTIIRCCQIILSSVCGRMLGEDIVWGLGVVCLSVAANFGDSVDAGMVRSDKHQ